MVTFTRKLSLAIISLYSIFLPAAAEVFAPAESILISTYLLDLPFPYWILPILFLFLLQFAIFMIPLNILSSRIRVDKNTVGVLAGILAAIGTYYGAQNQLIWSLWLGLFTGGIFIVAMVILVGALLMVVGLVMRGGAYAAGGFGKYAEKRKGWLERARGKEEQRALYAEERARSQAKAEEYGASRTRAFLRSSANNLARIAKSDRRFYTPAQWRQMIEAERAKLNELRSMFKAEERKLGIEYGESKIVRGRETKAIAELRTEMRGLKGRTGLARSEYNLITRALNMVNQVVKQIKAIEAQYRLADKFIAKAGTKLKAAEKLKPGISAKSYLTEAYRLFQSAEKELIEIESMLEQKEALDRDAIQLIREARAIEGRETQVTRKEEKRGGFFRKGETFKGFK